MRALIYFQGERHKKSCQHMLNRDKEERRGAKSQAGSTTTTHLSSGTISTAGLFIKKKGKAVILHKYK